MTGPDSGTDRLPPLAREELSDDQRRAVAEIEGGPRGEMSGPFVPLLRSPGALGPLQRLGEYLRFDSDLAPRLRELAIMLTARRWEQRYEWAYHHPLALQAGVEEALLEEIRLGGRPDASAYDERCVIDVLDELWRTATVSEATYERCLRTFGERGLIDVVCIAGYYTTLALVMNLAGTPVPRGAPKVSW